MEQLLFDSGRPMLVSLCDRSRPVGEAIAIALNRSSKTWHLISYSMDLLRRALEVHVIAIEDWFVDGPGGGEGCDNLMAYDVAVHLHATGKGQFGYQTLHETQMLGVDLLLKGAYT